MDRAKAYDREQAALRRQKQHAQIDAMNARFIVIAQALQAKMLKQIEELLKKGQLSALATVMALKYAIDLERLAMGAVTERTEQIAQAEIRSAAPLPCEYDPETAALIEKILEPISATRLTSNKRRFLSVFYFSCNGGRSRSLQIFRARIQ